MDLNSSSAKEKNVNFEDTPKMDDGQQNQGNESPEWSSGLRRLHRAISISTKQSGDTYEDALNRVLSEVRENEEATEEDLLHKLMKQKERHPSVTSKASAILQKWSSHVASSPLQRKNAFLRHRSQDQKSIERRISDGGPRIPVVRIQKMTSTEEEIVVLGGGGGDIEVFKNEEENKDEDGELDINDSDDTESYRKLENIAKALAGSGQRGMETLRGALEHENLQTGLDRLITHIMHTFQDQWSQLFEFLVPWQQMQAMLLICCLQLINLHQLIKLFPIVTCYISFFAMIYCTLKMFHSRYWKKQTRVWRRLLNVFKFKNQTLHKKLSTAPSSSSMPDHEKFLDQSKEPFGNFFLALAAFVFSFALTDRRIMPNLFPICALSIFFSLTCLVALTDRESDHWVIGALALDLFSSLPYIFERFFHRELFAIFDNLITIRLGSMKLGFGISSLALASVLALYLYMAFSNHSNQNLRQVLVSHLVCFAWWHTGLELFLSSNSTFEWRHAILTTVIIWLILFPTWTAGATCIVVAVTQVKDFFSAVNILKTVSIGLIFWLPYSYKRLMKYLEDRADWTNLTTTATWWKEKKRKVILVYIILVLASCLILYGGRESPEVLKRTTSNLTWSEFYQHCSEDDLEKNYDQHGNLLQQQIACSEFGSTVVEWTGVIETIKIIDIENFLETIFYYLPDAFAQKFRCLYGTKADAFNGTTSTRKKCTVAQYNVYTFEIEVRGPWLGQDGQNATENSSTAPRYIGPGVAIVEASDVFEEIALDLQKGDIINFTAILDDDILNYPPRLNLLQIECMKCPRVVDNKRTSRVVSEAFYSEDHWFWTKIYNACRFVFNFACSPLIVIE